MTENVASPAASRSRRKRPSASLGAIAPSAASVSSASPRSSSRLGFLALLFGDIVRKGYSAFRQAHAELEIFFDPEVIDPAGNRDPEALRFCRLSGAGARGSSRAFPRGTSGRRERRELYEAHLESARPSTCRQWWPPILVDRRAAHPLAAGLRRGGPPTDQGQDLAYRGRRARPPQPQADRLGGRLGGGRCPDLPLP